MKSCPRGSNECNTPAKSVTAQLDHMARALSFSRFPLHVRENMWGPYVDDDDGAHGNTAHPQGFVQTNAEAGHWYYAFSHSEKEGKGSISFAEMRDNGEKWIDYVFETNTWHPYSLAQIGKYVLWLEQERLYVMDITKLKAYAGKSPPVVVHPGDYAEPVPFMPASGIGKGGGGLGIVQLEDGRFLVAVGMAGGDEGGVMVRFTVLSGSLAKPKDLTKSWVADLDFSCNGDEDHRCTEAKNGELTHFRDGARLWLPRRDENMSLVSDSNGAIYLFLPDSWGIAGLEPPAVLPDDRDRLYWYKLSLSRKTDQWFLRARATHAIPANEAVQCWYPGGTSARVDYDGVLQVMCMADDFDRSDHSDMRYHFWMHPCWEGKRTYGEPLSCSPP